MTTHYHKMNVPKRNTNNRRYLSSTTTGDDSLIKFLLFTFLNLILEAATCLFNAN